MQVRNSQNEIEKIVLIGLGSIGKKHLEFCLMLTNQVVVVDPNPLAREFVNGFDKKTRTQIEFLDSLDSITDDAGESLVIIANWGPNHFTTFKHFASKGYKKFIVEKPLVSKISDLEELGTLIKCHNLKVRTNMPWNYSDFDKITRELIEKEDMGPLLGMTVTGGAKCLATIGIHHIGLAIQMFGSEPISVNSSLHNSKINPRHEDLAYLEGVAFWEFSNNRYLTISFANQSHLQTFSVLSYQYGRILIEGEKAIVLKIDEADRATITKQVNTFVPSVEVTEFNPFANPLQDNSTARIYTSVLSESHLSEKDFGFAATNSLFGMLVSNAQKKSITLPMDLELLKEYREYDWKIS
jgi:predicted dehydrogenase